MVGEVEVGIVDPHRVREATRHRPHPLPVARHQPDALADQLDETVVVEALRRWLEDRHPADVHRGRGRLHVEEGDVQGAEPFGHVISFGRTIIAHTPRAARTANSSPRPPCLLD